MKFQRMHLLCTLWESPQKHDNVQCKGIGPGYIAIPQIAVFCEIQLDGNRYPFNQYIVSKLPTAR